MKDYGYRCIELTGKHGKGKVTIVDDDTYQKYGHLAWHQSNWGYAMRRVGDKGKPKRSILLHRLVMDAKKGEVVDHCNRNRLDNRRSNLRITTPKQNARNRSNVKGYTFDKSRNKWLVTYHKKFIGRYDTEQEASRAYQLAKSGQEHEKTRRKYYMLPKHVSKQFGKYVVGVKIDGKRYRKVSIPTLEEALSIRDNILAKEK